MMWGSEKVKVPDGQDDNAPVTLRQFATTLQSVANSMQELLHRLEKQDAKLAALGEAQGLAWQSGWLPKPKDGPATATHPTQLVGNYL